MNKLIFSLLMILISAPALAVTSQDDTILHLSGSSIDLKISAGSKYGRLVVNSTNIEITSTGTNPIIITSANRRVLANSAGLTTTCPSNGTSPSYITINSSSTVIVTPSATQCAFQSSGGSTGGGGIAYIPPAIKNPTATSPTTTITTSQIVEEAREIVIAVKPAPKEEQKALAVSGGFALDSYVGSLGAKKDSKAQKEWFVKTELLTKVDKKISTNEKYVINNFIVYGTKSTLKLSRSERLDVVASYNDVYKRLPKTEKQWSDAVAIANGKKPIELNKQSEATAIKIFKKVYKRGPNLKNNADRKAVEIVAYELLPVKRDAKSEALAGKKFLQVYGKKATGVAAKAIVRGIAYSGVKK
jgi:hypothetical protein